MKTTMKKLAAYLLALLLVFQIVPVMADEVVSNIQGSISEGEFRDKLAVTTDTAVLEVGMTVKLETTEGYDKLTWTSDNPEVASVENGVVTAKSAGQVKITAEQDGYTDSVTLKVIGAADVAGDSSEGEKMIIIITGKKDKVQYNGEVQTNTYTATSKSPDFNPDNLKLKDETAIASAKDCGVYKDTMSEASFEYEGAEAEFVVTNGWIQIKPLDAIVKPDDATKWEGDPDPDFTYTVTGLLDGDSIDLGEIEYVVTPINETTKSIIPFIDENLIVGNYRVKAAQGILTIQPLKEEYLYNIAKIGDKYYRLARTTFKTKIPDMSVYFPNKYPDKSLLKAEPYVFDDVVINLNGTTYYYDCPKNAEKILKEGANYYTAKAKNIQVIKGKISGSKEWLVPNDQRYTDPENKDSYHRDFDITLYENNLVIEEQEIFNLVSVNGSKNYHRLKKTTIHAVPYETAKNELKAGEYVLTPYDFTDVKIVIDGEEYSYSDHEITDEYYDNYYTVSFDKVVKETLINKDGNWFKNDAGWLDGAKEQYGDIPNNTPGYHANYKATTHKGVKAPESEEIDTSGMSIYVHSDWPEGQKGFTGAKITLSAELIGFEGREYTLQWQYTDDNENWNNIPGANDISYTYTLDSTTTQYSWRVIAVDVR